MEALLLDSPELEDRRAQAADFIQDNLQLVRSLIEDGAFQEAPEENIDAIESFETFDHQLDALGAIWAARETGADRALLHMATGLGKTSVGVFDVVKFYEEFRIKIDRAPRVLFACHKKEILEQAAERFGTFIPDLSQGFYADTLKDRDADITFATLQSLYSSLDDFDPEAYDYIIYDEAHHSKADTFEQVVDHFSPQFQLALTATPDRLDQRDITELFGEAVYSKSLAEALAEGLLVEPDYHIVFDDAVKEALDTDFSPTSVKELRELLDVWPRNEQIAENIKAEMEKLGLELGKAKTIVFCQDIAHSEDMAWLLEGEAYHSELPKSKRKEILQRFRDGDLQTICVRDMFNEGIDIPDAELLVFLRSTVSETVFEQQLGRGLRKHEGKETVTVLDFAANIERVLMIRELAENVEESLPTFVSETNTTTQDETEDNNTVIEYIYKNFSFDKLSIDLLKKYDQLRPETAPDGHMSVNAFAEAVGVARTTLSNLIKAHGIRTGRYRYGQVIGLGLSIESQEELLEIVANRVGPPPEGYVSVNAFSKSVDMSTESVARIMSEHNIEAEKHRYHGRVRLGLNPEAQQQLLKVISERVGPPPEGYVSVSKFRDVVGLNQHTLDKVISEHGVSTESHRFGPVVGRSLSPGSQNELRDIVERLSGRDAPEGYVSVSAFARQLGLATETVKRRIASHDIETSEHRYGGPIGVGLSPESQQQLKEIIEAELEPAPDDYVTVNAFAKRSGISTKTTLEILEANGITTKKTHGKGRPVAESIGPEEQKQLEEIIARRQTPPPEGYMSVQEFARSINVGKKFVTRLIAEHEIETETHAYKNRPMATLSPEAQAKLRQTSTGIAPLPPSGYTSATAFARSMHLDLKTIKRVLDEQGISTETHRYMGHASTSLSPEVQAILREILPPKPDDAPKDYVSLGAFAEDVHAGVSRIRSVMEKLEIPEKKYWFRGRTGVGLGPEDQTRIREALSSK